MGDSDDEYDRKRRDKFRGERGSGGGGGGGGGEGGGGGGYRGGDRRGDDRGRGRDDWADRNRGRPDYRDYRGPGGGGGGRDRFSPDRGGPAKRMRTEWGEDGRPRYGGGHDPYGPYGGGGWGGGGHHEFAMHGGGGHGGFGGGGHREALHSRSQSGGAEVSNGDMQTQPPMLTLKQFLANQDDSISDSDAITKYNEYKQDFRRQQLNEFFVTHKDEEWFKIKYHPQESLKRKEEQLNFLKHRAAVFTEQLEIGTVAAASVDTTQTEKLLRLLDTVVIKLEGGTDADLKVLDEKPVEPRGPMEAVYQAKTGAASFAAVLANKSSSSTTTTAKTEPSSDGASGDPKPKSTALATDENWDNDGEDAADGGKKNPFAGRSKTDDDAAANDAAAPQSATADDNEKAASDAPQSPAASEGVPGKVTKRKRSASDSSSSSSSSSSSDEDGDDEKNDAAAEKTTDEVAAPEKEVDEEPAKDETKVGSPKSGQDAGDDGDAEMKDVSKSGDADDDEAAAPTDAVDNNGDVASKEDATEASAKPAVDEKSTTAAAVTTIETIDLDKEKDDDKPAPLKALHRTSSIFLRNLAPTITKAEVEAMCRRYAGFLRVAIADPLVDRRWFRRGWVTFERDVNIKEICWNLNNIRLRDCELGAIVNRDLSRRVRPINGITAHRQIVRSDVKLCAKIAFNLDARAGLWTSAEGGGGADSGDAATSGGGDSNGAGSEAVSFGLKSSNPVLQNITDYLIEEASAEEDELLGLSTGGGTGGSDAADGSSAADGEPLDRDPQLIAVLDRLILYLRVVHSVDFYNHCEYPYEDEMPNRCGIIHARGPAPQNRVTQQELQEYTRSFEGKMSSFLAKAQPLDEAELRVLGTKDMDGEVEKFVAANTQELAKDKWLCPLSGKKFKGPDFIRKHIFNKHAEKVDEVRKEVEYFNNYLKDPKRPQLPEHPGNQRRPPAASGGGAEGGMGGGGHPHGYRPGFHPPGGYGGYGGYGGPMVAPSRPRGGGGFGGRRELPSDHQRRIIGYQDLDAPDYDFFP